MRHVLVLAVSLPLAALACVTAGPLGVAFAPHPLPVATASAQDSAGLLVVRGEERWRPCSGARLRGVRQRGDTITLWWEERLDATRPCAAEPVAAPFEGVVRGLRRGTYVVRLDGAGIVTPAILAPVRLR